MTSGSFSRYMINAFLISATTTKNTPKKPTIITQYKNTKWIAERTVAPLKPVSLFPGYKEHVCGLVFLSVGVTVLPSGARAMQLPRAATPTMPVIALPNSVSFPDSLHFYPSQSRRFHLSLSYLNRICPEERCIYI